MTILVQHRVNTIEKLKEVSNAQGAEIDLRISFGKLVLAHDPFQEGCEFRSWIQEYMGRLLVINVKEMGLEELIVSELQYANRRIEFFFLDIAVPYLLKSQGVGYECAARVSEFETLESALLLNSKWLWIDSFTGNWDHLKELKSLKSLYGNKKKICLVSPELQGRNLMESNELSKIINLKEKFALDFDAICTKLPVYWRRYVN